MGLITVDYKETNGVTHNEFCFSNLQENVL